ncbi:MAG: hypothetical protein SO031_06705, partial [Candidatus Ventricola sp.]|nr:hypothetical protein [Candidatus Ventricola sp.]
MSNDANKKPPKKNAPLTPAEEETLSGEALDATRLSIGGDTQTVAGAHTSRMPAPVTGTPRDKKRKKKKADDASDHPHSIFKPRTKYPNFLLSVLVSTIRLSALLILCACLALAGALIGIAKAYVDTAPTLDLAALGAQDKT